MKRSTAPTRATDRAAAAILTKLGIVLALLITPLTFLQPTAQAATAGSVAIITDNGCSKNSATSLGIKPLAVKPTELVTECIPLNQNPHYPTKINVVTSLKWSLWSPAKAVGTGSVLCGDTDYFICRAPSVSETNIKLLATLPVSFDGQSIFTRLEVYVPGKYPIAIYTKLFPSISSIESQLHKGASLQEMLKYMLWVNYLPSPPASTTMQPLGPPGLVRDIKVAKIKVSSPGYAYDPTDYQLSVSWKAPKKDGGFTITNYNVDLCNKTQSGCEDLGNFCPGVTTQTHCTGTIAAAMTEAAERNGPAQVAQYEQTANGVSVPAISNIYFVVSAETRAAVGPQLASNVFSFPPTPCSSGQRPLRCLEWYFPATAPSPYQAPADGTPDSTQVQDLLMNMVLGDLGGAPSGAGSFQYDPDVSNEYVCMRNFAISFAKLSNDNKFVQQIMSYLNPFDATSWDGGAANSALNGLLNNVIMKWMLSPTGSLQAALSGFLAANLETTVVRVALTAVINSFVSAGEAVINKGAASQAWDIITTEISSASPSACSFRTVPES